MTIRTVVRAILSHKTPAGPLKIHVTWSHYEAKAVLTVSGTSSEAFDKFLHFGARIIDSSNQHLRYLDSISFYEESKERGGLTSTSCNHTKRIFIIREGEEVTGFKVE